MLQLLLDGQYPVVLMLLAAIIFSLTLHEYGHARSALALGDDTALHMGRVTLNPIAHIDFIGLLMVVLIGFGYAKPVPINTRRLRQHWAPAVVAAAGPFMNLMIALVSINVLVWGVTRGVIDGGGGLSYMLMLLAQINVLLMLFNLIPLGPLDGHYILSWLLPPRLGARYDDFNGRYGSHVFLLLILLSIAGVPIFNILTRFSSTLMPFLTFV